MIRFVVENLVRQNKAMLLLSALLEEEFSRLQKGEPRSVSQIELSIQELMRQIAVERASLRRLVGRVHAGAQRVSDLYPAVDETVRGELQGLLQILDDTEQRCAVQAGKNKGLVTALYDQSRKLLGFMHEEVRPKPKNAYSAKGRFVNSYTGARLIQGRF
ncbi:flagellar export chaperone FlgN [Pseudodesulfovibrio tunisiensis]|uniref:flagellar export chaperone FlgN n=1 Tax=Pseudodesulfovibrio tunisiensis TaxID=463192 RepID=UPI001FB512D9|nr:flagellar export chaperone FlgN [Pseudodesulfovibrio tunisiensis]